MQITNMSIKSLSPILDSALSNIPDGFRARVISTYLEVKRNCVEGRYEAAGLSVGKFCEVILRVLQEKLTGTYSRFGVRIQNFADECNTLMSAPVGRGNESERVVMPRALVYMYTMRNKRGIGHVGGDVDANEIDVTTMAKTADWVVCELIRINHGLSLEEAQDLVDGLSVRYLPMIWEVAGKKRVLKLGLPAKDQALLLLYQTADRAVLVEDLCEWVEYSRLRDFQRFVVTPLHKARLVEYDKESDTVHLSPVGVSYVEEKLL